MNSQIARKIIDHVQKQRAGSLESPLEDNFDLPKDHPRPLPPDWIPPHGPCQQPRRPGSWSSDEILRRRRKLEIEINDDISEEADAVEGASIDVYAYYLPFHFYNSPLWGIYVRARGVFAVAAYLSSKVLISDLTQNELNSAYRILLEHEAFHHHVELACPRAYVPWDRGILYYRYRSYAQAGLHEEAMANAYAFRRLAAWHRRTRFSPHENLRIQSRVTDFMKAQPAGYRDFYKHIDTAHFMTGKDVIIEHLRSRASWGRWDFPNECYLKGRRYFLGNSISQCPVNHV